MNSDNVRKAIIKEVSEYLADWGSMHYIQIGANIEDIINRYFKEFTLKKHMRNFTTDELENIVHEIIVERYEDGEK